MIKKGGLRTPMVALLIDPLPKAVRDDLLRDRVFTARFGITPR